MKTTNKPALALAATISALFDFLGVPTASHAGNEPHMHDMMTWKPELFLMSELLEYVPLAQERPLRYDLTGWFGGDTNRIWMKAEGSQSTEAEAGETEVQLLYGRLISPFWDVQAGLRLDLGYGGGTDARVLLAVGLEGLAPGWFEVEPSLFVSHEGDVSASLTTSYDLYLTQRLVAQARFETAAAVQSVPEFGIGAGINGVDLGLRIRYEIAREFAPYVGVAWQRRLMESGDLARAAGEDLGQVSVVLGLQLWY
ncbi:MAG TPA: copper resistance protein B [Polyangia bacterium]